MADESYQTLVDSVTAQVKLLEAGKPLEAFDAFFDHAVFMYANDALFASGAAEGRAKQMPYINGAQSIGGRIADVNVVEERSICVFRNLSTFKGADGLDHQIDGLCWQRWEHGSIVEERYYDGAKMQELIAEGILNNPAMIFSKRR